MKPLRLRASNYRVFTELDVEFIDGLTVILGEVRNAPDGVNSNGSGKSSILEGIDIALYGRRSLAGFLTRGGDATELMLELTFEHGGGEYRVRRSYSARTKAGKTTVDFETFDDGADAWRPLTCESTKQTDALIVETIGLSLDAYRFSSYLRQGEGGIATRDPKQRKELLVEAGLGRDPVWPRAREAAKASRLTAQAGLERLAGETRAARELVETKADVDRESVEALAAEESATHVLATAETELQTIVERYQAAKDGAARRQACEAELAAARAELDRLQRLDVAATEAVLVIGQAREALTGLPAATETNRLESRITELEAAVDAWKWAASENQLGVARLAAADRERADLGDRASAFKAKAETLAAQIAHLEEGALDNCPTCKQALGADARAETIASLAAQSTAALEAADALRRQAEEITVPAIPAAPEGDPPTRELETVRGQMRATQQATADRARLEERITQLQVTVDARPHAENLAGAQTTVMQIVEKLDDIEPVNLAAIEAAGTQARATVAQHRLTLDTAKTIRARLDERLATITKATETLEAASVQERDLQATIDVETVIERACGRDGIPALIIENRVIPYLETEATRILGELGIGFSVELRTQSEKKDGSGLKDTLDVIVFDRDGNEADFAEGTSGGEQTRVGFVLQIALAEYLALTGRGSRLLAVDEPPYLDKSGLIALNRVLEDFVARGLFDQVLVVSHDAELRDSVEQTITVINDGGRSTIAGDAVLEPVEEIAA